MDEQFTLDDSQRKSLAEKLNEIGLEVFGRLSSSFSGGNILPPLDNRGEDYPRIYGDIPLSIAKFRGDQLILENTDKKYFNKYHVGLRRLYHEIVGE